jgi:transposase InsO family protein
MFSKLGKESCRETGSEITKLKSDQGGEFISDMFQKHLQEAKVCQELTTPHTPEQNGYLEHDKRTIVEIVRNRIRRRD